MEGSWGTGRLGEMAGMGDCKGSSPTSCSLGPEPQRGRKTSTGSEAVLGAAVLMSTQPPALIAARSRAAVAGG